MTNLPTLQPNSITRVDAARELLRRRKARTHMMAFVKYVWPEFQVNWHHEVIADHLDRWLQGDIPNLMIFTPAQHGKSELVSRRLPACLLGQKPDAKVIAASYAAELIQGMNRDVQRTMESPEYRRLFPETRLNEANIRTVAGSWLRNNDIFEVVGRRGSYRCAGIGGGLSGFPCDYGIIDDPFKDYKEAASKTIRDSVWEWYTSVFLRRCHSESRQLITQTRWHEDDLCGRLLDKEPERWTVLKLTGICEDTTPEYEQREIGEALWPARFDVDTLERQRALNPHQFEAMTQQNPSPREGSFFKPANIEIVDALPANLKYVRGWDIGATANGGDPTTGVKIGTDGNGIFYIADVVHGHWATDERDREIRQTAELDGKNIKQRLPQDPGAAGKSLAVSHTRLLAGYSVITKPVSGDKETRADPFSSQVNAGNVKMLRADWNRDYIEELRQFPNGKFDDRVDASADAFDEVNEPVTEFSYAIA